MLKAIIATFIILNSIAVAYTQEDSLWSIDINEIKVKHDAVDKHLRSVYVKKMDSSLNEIYAGVPLSMTLNTTAPVYIKQDAPGLATISIRGTGPDHTAIMWGCINVNSLTLGHSNMANISTFLFNDIEILYGSAGALLGTDAMGGAVMLSSDTPQKNQYSIMQEVASFHNYFTGAKAYITDGKVSSSTKLYHAIGKNDFPFTHTSKSPLEKDYKKDTQLNANVHNYGIIQELNYDLNKKNFLSGKFWFENNVHGIKPRMASNDEGEAVDSIEEIHIRSQLHYNTAISKKSFFNAWCGHVRDNQLYKNSQIMTNRVLAKAEYNQNFTKFIDLKIGEDVKYIFTNVHAYETQRKELRADSYLSSIFTLNRLVAVLSFRNSYVTGVNFSNVPSATVRYKLISRDFHSLKARGTIAESYKVPTLNDRFWEPGGNPDLLPEKGINYELGFDYSFIKNTLKSKFSANVFYKNVSNWIQWTPGAAYWEAKNYKRVESKGADMFFDVSKTFGKWKAIVNSNFAYTSVVTKETASAADSLKLDKQMYYSPKYLGGISISIKYKYWLMTVSSNYHGKVITRYDQNYTNGRKSLPPYYMTNFTISKKIKISRTFLTVASSIYNAFDVVYQSIEDYAMPGRNYSIRLSLNFN